MDWVNGAGPVTQGFGANPQFAWQLGYGHLGMDWGVKIGTSVVSIANDVGTVLFADWGHKMPAALANSCMFIVGSPNSGIVVVIQFDGWRVALCHLDSTHLNPGNKVRRGDVVGKSGNTGNSTGPHLHAENWVGNPAVNAPPFGRYNPLLQIQHEDRIAAAAPKPAPAPAPAPKAPAANVRRVGPHAAATFRDAPNVTSSKIVASADANSYEAFVGYVVALPELNIGGVRSNMWYVDRGEDGKGKERYSWAGLYTEQRTAGLPNLTPPEKPADTLAPNQRKGGPAGLIWRPEPKVGDTVLRTEGGGSIQNFTHYAKGQKVTSGGVTTDIWYKDSFGWVWSGAFTEQSTRGLTMWEEPKPLPTPADYTFKASLPCVTKVMPAHPANFVRGSIPTPPDTIVFHQFNGNTPEEDPVTNRNTVHLGSLENTFIKVTDRIASIHWAGEGVNVTQFVHHTDRAQHAGPDGNGFWGVELYGGMDAETIQTAGRILREANELRAAMGGKGRLKVKKHDEIMQTKCGRNVDLEAIQRAAYPEEYQHPAPVPAPTPAPAPVPDPIKPSPVLDRESIIREYQDWQSSRDRRQYLEERK